MIGRAPNLSAAAFSQGSQLVRVRRSFGTHINGRWVESADQDQMIRMAVRPISPSYRKLLPEGMQTEDSISFLTWEPLKVERSAANGGSAADRVFVEGWWWVIVGEKPWTPNGFRRYIGIREAIGRDRAS